MANEMLAPTMEPGLGPCFCFSFLFIMVFGLELTVLSDKITFYHLVRINHIT